MKVSDKRRLARRPVDLTVMGLGCAQMGSLFRATSLADCAEAYEASWEAGIRYFDTAPFYGYTRSERRLGTLLDDRARGDFALSTKVGRVMVPDDSLGPEEDAYVAPLPFRPVYDYSHDGILRSFEASQQRLGMTRADILYVHDIGTMTHGAKAAHYWDQLTAGGGFRALERLRAEGAAGAVGLGVNEWQVVRDALEVFDIDVAMLAGRYTLLEQESLALMDECAARGVGIVAAGVFNSGILAGNAKFNYADAPEEMIRRVAALDAACREAGVPLQAAALQFPLLHPAVVSVVSGCRTGDHVRANVAWMEQDIPADFWAGLSARGLIGAGAPVSAGA